MHTYDPQTVDSQRVGIATYSVCTVKHNVELVLI